MQCGLNLSVNASHCHLPYQGRLWRCGELCEFSFLPRAPLLGELASECEPEGFDTEKVTPKNIQPKRSKPMGLFGFGKKEKDKMKDGLEKTRTGFWQHYEYPHRQQDR